MAGCSTKFTFPLPIINVVHNIICWRVLMLVFRYMTLDSLSNIGHEVILSADSNFFHKSINDNTVCVRNHIQWHSSNVFLMVMLRKSIDN